MYSSKDLEYMNYTLGDIKVIELLILYRYKYDDYKFIEEGETLDTAETIKLNEEVLITYADLDKLIEDCNFSTQERDIIRMTEDGYTSREIGFELNIFPSTIQGRLRTIYKKILEENKRKWRTAIYKNTLNLKTKTCSKCKDELPGTSEFYTADSRNKDG